MKVSIVTASNGKNLELAQRFEEYFKNKNIEAAIIDVVKLNLPLYSTEAEKQHDASALIQPLQEKLQADAFVFLAPEYNGGTPPTFSNFLAWVSRSTKNWRETFNEKPAAIGTFSGGAGAHVLTQMRLQLSFLGMNVLGRQLSVHTNKELEHASLAAVCDQLIR